MSEELDLSIDNYISDEFSICREERQYALYLSNVLRYYGKNPNKKNNNSGPYNRVDNEKIKNIFIACGFNEKELENIVIENVFYEATFMRDIFERNRRHYLAVKDGKKPEDEYSKIRFAHKDYMVATKNSFNYNLLNFCNKIIYGRLLKDENITIAERNYGGKDNFIDELKYEELKLEDLNKEKDDGKWNKFKILVRAMMNAKPDLAVINYNDNEKSHRKLLFIECKYCSGESKTKNVLIRQRAVQGYIAEFLCEFSGYMNGVQVSRLMHNNEQKENEGKYLSKMIKFVADDAKEDEGQISIKDLIGIEEGIFNK